MWFSFEKLSENFSCQKETQFIPFFYLKKNTKTVLYLPIFFYSTQQVLKVFKSGTTKQ